MPWGGTEPTPYHWRMEPKAMHMAEHPLGRKLIILCVQSMPGASLNSMQILSLNNKEIKDTEGHQRQTTD